MKWNISKGLFIIHCSFHSSYCLGILKEIGIEEHGAKINSWSVRQNTIQINLFLNHCTQELTWPNQLLLYYFVAHGSLLYCCSCCVVVSKGIPCASLFITSAVWVLMTPDSTFLIELHIWRDKLFGWHFFLVFIHFLLALFLYLFMIYDTFFIFLFWLTFAVLFNYSSL